MIERLRLIGIIVLLCRSTASAWDCVPPAGYYDVAEGLDGQDLLLALRAIIDDHNSLGYTDARETMYSQLDCMNGNTLCCIYTNRCESDPDICCLQGAGEHDFNCEHSWPQGTFSGHEPMRADLFNLHPCDEIANSVRNNNPYGEIIGSPTWQQGGSMRGSDGDRTVFEPRDEVKGDCARSIFYMMARYSLEELESDGQYIDNKQIAVLLRWNRADPPDDAECIRADSIYGHQENRNPFIDAVEFADLVWANVIFPTPMATSTPIESPIVQFTETPTPFTTPTPGPEISPTSDIDPAVSLIMPAEHFTEGDPCWLHAFIDNPGPPRRNLNFCVVLDIGTEDYWFWPGWRHYPPAIDYQQIAMLNTGSSGIIILNTFAFPAVEGCAEGFRFFGLLLDAQASTIIGEVGVWEFSFGP